MQYLGRILYSVNHSRFVQDERGEMSDTLVSLKSSHSRAVQDERGEMSDTCFELLKSSHSRAVQDERGERSTFHIVFDISRY